MKQCKKCNEIKDESIFNKDSTRPDGFHPYCRSCRAQEKRNAYNADPEKAKEQKRRSYAKHKERLKKEQREYFATPEGKARARRIVSMSRYGITQEQYDSMRESQDYKCLICDTHETEVPKGNSASYKTALHIDHCHSTGEIRGLLCTNCNTMLGKAKDNIVILQSAIFYLTKEQQ